MNKDIFAEYIQGLQGKKSLPGDDSDGERWIGEDNALEILKEINQKINKFSGIQASCPVHEENFIDMAIINGKIVIPDAGVFLSDIYIRDGLVVGLGRQKDIQAKKVIDASGKYICPGIIDPHVHLGLFASMETDLVSETKAAIMGGITSIGVFLGGEDSHFETFPKIKEKIEKLSYVDVFPHFVISNEFQKNEISGYEKSFGVTSFKVYMNGIPGMIPDVDDGFILDVFDEIRNIHGKQCVLCCHTENASIVARALKKTKEECGDSGNIEDWEKTHPAMAEEEAVMRISYLAAQEKMPVYLVHIGTSEGIEKLRQIKPFNPYLFIETTSPYLSVAGEQRKNPLFKMEPPLRGVKDQEALWKALRDGIIDTVGTDNVCETIEEKRDNRPIWDVVPGYSVLQTHLPAVLTEGVIKRGLDIERVIRSMTKRPAEIFGIYPKKGTLLPGSDADITIIDINLEKEVYASSLISRSDFSIYEGRALRGWPVMTIKGGYIFMENGKMVSENSRGKILLR